MGNYVDYASFDILVVKLTFSFLIRFKFVKFSTRPILSLEKELISITVLIIFKLCVSFLYRLTYKQKNTNHSLN